ncbi:MAG: hypothetical protein ACLQVJ_28485 [Syntrophobacteraceae bacterium]
MSSALGFDDSEPENLLLLYLRAKKAVLDAGYGDEVEWQASISFEEVDENHFLREAAWVVLSSGMRETVVRKKFPEISHAFFEWESARKISARADQCRQNALACFGHLGKINAIIFISAHVERHGFGSVQRAIEAEGIPYIMQFPFMGPATSFHFAKNIGLSVVKPDRHLVRIAKRLGYKSPEALCSEISNLTGDRVSVVDIVLWRYATLYGSSV